MGISILFCPNISKWFHKNGCTCYHAHHITLEEEEAAARKKEEAKEAEESKNDETENVKKKKTTDFLPTLVLNRFFLFLHMKPRSLRIMRISLVVMLGASLFSAACSDSICSTMISCFYSIL